MSRRGGKIVCRASWCDLISADFREESFSTATPVINIYRALMGTDSLVRINFSANGDAQGLMSPDIENSLLRISQEAITNAMKHLGANQINVRLSAGREAVQLAVEDNGSGFDPHVSTLSRGLGLISMQERADRIGGDLTILTKPGSFTAANSAHDKTWRGSFPRKRLFAVVVS